MPSEVGRQENLTTHFYYYATQSENKILKRNRRKVTSFPSTKKGDLGITKNYSGITLTAIAAKVNNTLLFNCIRPEIEKILRKN